MITSNRSVCNLDTGSSLKTDTLRQNEAGRTPAGDEEALNDTLFHMFSLPFINLKHIFTHFSSD